MKSPYRLAICVDCRYYLSVTTRWGGRIPSNISGCSNLIVVRLGNNKLIGEIPTELGSLSKLEILSLGINQLTGTIPTSLGNMSSIQEFYANRNKLFGNLPPALGQLRNLRLLYLAENSFSGTIPVTLFNLSSFRELDVGNNQLHGNPLLDLGIALPNLQSLMIGDNLFAGSIPVSISNASNLQFFQFLDNMFTGKVPSLGKLHKLSFLVITSNYLGNGTSDDLSFVSSLTNATDLQTLAINGNNFGGEIPKQIGNLSTALEYMLLDHNHLVGSIPTEIENLVSLQDFEAHYNYLSGVIPSSIGKLPNLEILMLGFNSFSGHIPSSLGHLTKLFQLYLRNNHLQGDIPQSLGNCTELLLLDLSENNLTGAIPSEIARLSSLSIYLDLSSNRLSGSLPIEIGNLKSLGTINVSRNMLSGEIPSSLGSCTSLEFLQLDANFFQGSIPSSLSLLRGIVELNLSQNNLSGNIPEFLQNLESLALLDLSYNNFEGMVPTEGVFKNASQTSVEGNINLCGGIPALKLPRCEMDLPKRRQTLKLKLIVSAVSVLSGIALLLGCLFLFCSRKGKKESTASTDENGLLRASYQSLHRATNGFSVDNLIGSGHFGSVYKGFLDEDRRAIAVKVLNLIHQGASKSFMAECEALRNTRHRNLVKVLTACSGVDYCGNDFKALVYEFMDNGSLDDWLHPTHRSNDAPKLLNILQRVRIAIDVACALEYLHNHCETPIVHCDIKPSNVLLDAEMTGHVGDFGLAKFMTEATTGQSTSIGLRGTIGYAPPEYGIGSDVSAVGDVYSYGILLLEMFTGKRPTDEMFKGNLSLHSFVKLALPDQVTEIADPALIQLGSDGEATSTQNHSVISHRRGRIIECLMEIFRIAVSCSVDLPHERMNISDVVSQLSSIKKKLDLMRFP